MKSNVSVDDLVKTYGLMPHPEGGFFKETYRSSEGIKRSALPPRFSGDRSFSTAIYYLLPEGSKSSLHRIAADEVWHFYLGGTLELTEILPDGRVRKTLLGQELKKGECVQCVVPAGAWFGARPLKGAGYAFVGCTVAPGFDFADFEMGSRSALLEKFPGARSEIELLTGE